MSKTPPLYEITVRGHLAAQRLRDFYRLTITQLPSGETVLVGPFRDQSALYGLLSWLRDMGVALVCLRRLEQDESACCKTAGRDAPS